jgi:hypothetical protein
MNGGDIDALFLGHLAGERACEHPSAWQCREHTWYTTQKFGAK